jgi:hypothetical protein
VCQAYGQLFGEELRGAEEGAGGRSFAELDHLAEGDA